MTDEASEALLTLTADIVAAHVSNNSVAVGDLPRLIGSVHAALSGLGGEPAQSAAEPEPAVSLRSSVKPDYIVCLEDGKKMKMLKRHLMTNHQMTPADYRAKWKLPASYPMVAANYSETRRGLAHKIGLGQKRRGTLKIATPKAERKTPAAKAGVRKPRKTKAATAPAQG